MNDQSSRKKDKRTGTGAETRDTFIDFTDKK